MADPSKVRGILGLFSKAAPAEEGVNLARRGALGLPRRSEVLLPSQVETHLPAVVPPAPAPAQPPAVIGAIEQVIAEKLAKPTTRREFMGEGVKAAASAALRRAAPGALKQVVKQVAKPAIDEATAAGAIADYVTSVYNNERSASLAYKIANGIETEGLSDDFVASMIDSLDPEQLSSAWAELKYAEGTNWQDAARTIGLDPQTIAKETGLPQSLVKKLVGSGEELLGELAETADMERSLQQIIEDGRGKEAARSSSYLDVLNDEPFLNESLRKAMQDLGPDADDWDITNEVNNILRERFDAMERGHQTYNAKTGYSEYTPPESENLLRSALRKRIVSDDLLDSVWQQAGEEYNTPDLINDALNVIRQEKPVAEMVAPATAGQFPWRNDVLRWFESHEGTPHGSDKSYVANRALNYGDDASSWIKDFKKYHDELSASNPNASVAEKISTMQSQTGLPAEFVEAIFNRIP